MKLLACCAAVLAVATLGQCLTSSEELMSVKVNMLKDYLRERQALTSLIEKVETVCPGYGNKFEGAIGKVQKCINDIDEDSETACSTVKNHLEKCAKPVTELFQECLPEKSKDIPEFAIKSLVSLSDYVCKTDGEHIFELYNPCVRSSNYRTQRCIRKIQTKLQQYNSKTPAKSELCEFLSSFRGCVESHLHYSCGHATTREAVLKAYDAMIAPCEDKVPTLSLNEIEVLEPYRSKIEWVDRV